MFKALNVFIAVIVLAVVMSGLLLPAVRVTIFESTMGGVFVGIAHGLLHVYCLHELLNDGKPLTASRVQRIMFHAVRMDMVIGLLIGVVNAV